MAIYHFSAKVVSRGKGQSAVAKAAYNSRERLEDERTGDAHDYRRKGGLLFSGIFAPKNAPEWVRDRATLYNEIERREKRKDAQLVREVEIALPHELSEIQRERLVKDFVREQFVRKGMAADVSIHAPDREGDERNHHAHILLTMREIGPDGFGEKVREWNGKKQLEHWREAWEWTANRYLERHGFDVRIDGRTLEDQGIDREPTRHLGPQANAMERDGIGTERGALGHETDARNASYTELKVELAAVQNEISALELGTYLDNVDRDREKWDNALHAVAVEKEKVERKFVEPHQVAQVLRDPDDKPMSGLAETRSEFLPERARYEPQEHEIRDAWQGPQMDESIDHIERGAVRLAGKLVDSIAAEAEHVLAALGDFLDPAFTPTRETRSEMKEAPEKSARARVDFKRYMEDDDYRREIARREIAERQQRERDYYVKQKERER